MTPFLDGTTSDSTPVQVESGWSFSSVLTKGGDVYVWWPLNGEMQQLVDARNTAMDEEGLHAHATEHGIIPCAHWELSEDPYRLPELPRLPRLDELNAEDAGAYLVKIAALDCHLIGLTNHGHVVKILVQTRDTARLEGWVYVRRFLFRCPHLPMLIDIRQLSQFSESEKIRRHVTSASSDLSSLPNIRITHVSQGKTTVDLQ